MSTVQNSNISQSFRYEKDHISLQCLLTRTQKYSAFKHVDHIKTLKVMLKEIRSLLILSSSEEFLTYIFGGKEAHALCHLVRKA